MTVPPPPPSPAYGWQMAPTAAPRPERRLLGVRRWVWLAAWLPALWLVLFDLWMPAFVRPLLDAWPATLAVLGVLVLINLAAGRSRGAAAPVVAVVLTTGVGLLWAFLGPAVVLVGRTIAGR